MGVFHVSKIVQIVQNQAKHHIYTYIYLTVQAQTFQPSWKTIFKEKLFILYLAISRKLN